MSNSGVLAFVVSFAVLAALTVAFVYPWLFNSISGIFTNSDLGALVAIAILFLMTGLVLMVLLVVSSIIARIVD